MYVKKFLSSEKTCRLFFAPLSHAACLFFAIQPPSPTSIISKQALDNKKRKNSLLALESREEREREEEVCRSSLQYNNKEESSKKVC
jgi:hypothetical protein